jgi:DNA-binding CsgD family transcriptional regulator
MDKSTQREIRLQELARRLASGDMTEEEREEYNILRDEQSTEESSAILQIAREQVKFRFPWFRRRRS